MERMIRKQIYIGKVHDALLKRLAAQRGVSEADVIRQAIEQHARGAAAWHFRPDPEAWQRARALAMQIRSLGPLDTPARKWNREELYEERISRYVHDPH